MQSIIIYNANGIHSLFYNGLKNMALNVSAFIDQDFEGKMQLSLPEKILKTAKNLALKKSDLSQIRERKAERYKEKRIDQISIANFDLVFIISPQNTERKFLQKIIDRSNKKIAYHWDGIHRFPDMTKNDDLFDRVYVFDPADADAEKYFFTTNCYFDDPQIEYPKDFEIYYNTFFSEEKIETLSIILKNLPGKDAKISVRVFNEEQANFARGKLGNSVQIETETQDYRHILDITQRAKVLLDIKAEEHNGLSFRFFEALCYRCKLVTNNAAVKDYDFYRPENIFVFNADTKSEELQEFLNLPYCEIPEKIRLRYYFPNWFERMMDL